MLSRGSASCVATLARERPDRYSSAAPLSCSAESGCRLIGTPAFGQELEDAGLADAVVGHELCRWRACFVVGGDLGDRLVTEATAKSADLGLRLGLPGARSSGFEQAQLTPGFIGVS